MPADIITIIVALILIVIAWKAFTGIVKTLALVAILIVAAIVVFGGSF
ncbi:hypothetical protein [Pelagerythrobacter sp.]